jgi:hypothetical protein
MESKKDYSKLNLENIIRIAFHPKGYKDYMAGLSNEFELGPVPSSINKGTGVFIDVIKYVAYVGVLDRIVY